MMINMRVEVVSIGMTPVVDMAAGGMEAVVEVAVEKEEDF